MPVIIRQRARVRGTANQGKGRGISPVSLERLKADLETYGQQQVDGHNRFTSTWEGERPVFKPIVEDTEVGVRLRVVSSGTSYAKLKYRWVSGGTDVRYATMGEDEAGRKWKSKTKRRSLNSGDGAGELAYVDKNQPRPGIEAREIDELLKEQLEPAFIEMIRAKYHIHAKITSRAGVRADG